MAALSDIYKYQSSNGIFIPDLNTLKDSIITDIKESVFKEDIDVTDETPIGRLIEWFAIVLYGCICLNAESINQLNLNYATGRYLDALASLYNLQRKSATHTRVLCRLFGIAGTLIPQGSLARSTATESVFAAEEDIVLDDSGNGIGYFVAVEEGDIPCPEGSVTVIDSAVSGWQTITNQTAGIIGVNEESDSSLRARIIASRSIGSAFTESMQNGILGLENVDSCVVYENGTNSSVIIKGVTVTAHSIYVCVQDGDDNAIANEIYKHKTAGCGFTTGSIGGTKTSVVVTDKSNDSTYTMEFYRPATLQPSVKVTLSRGEYSGDDLTTAVKSKVVEFMNAVQIGKDVTSIQLAMALQKEFPQCVISSVGFGSSGASANQTVNGYQKISMDSTKITVVIS